MLVFPRPAPLSLALFVDLPFSNITFPPSTVILLLSSLLPILVISQAPHSEQEILLKIKQQWGNPLAMQSWNSTTFHCHWLGISCNSGKSVTGINLNSDSIESEIPLSLCDLKNLTSLDLGINNIPGSFPTVLYNCTKLRTLVLSMNYFVGNLPDDINKLFPYLQHLDLSANNFTGHIPSSLAQLKGLITLDLSSNAFITFPSELGKLVNLETLGLAFNTFNGMSIPKEFGMLERMVSLDISNSQISGAIPSSVAYWRNLDTFQASNNQLWGNIPVELTALSSLQDLDLSYNQLSGHLPSGTMSWTSSLRSLNLASNNLSGPLPAALCSMSNLSSLDLSDNQLSGQVPPQLAQLQHLDLSSNCLSGKIPRSFCKANFDLSLLNNPNKCSYEDFSKSPGCHSSRHIYLLLIVVPGATIFLVFLYFTFSRVTMARQQEPSGEHQAWELKPYHRVDFTETDILSGLTDSNMIGSGGSGKVYRIILNDLGDKVAVKKIWNGRKLKDALEKQFLAEVEILGTFRHANIVKLLCCISCAHVKLLVYEYMEKQSLDKWLGSKKEANEPSTSTTDPSNVLDWPTRLKIAIGAAKALCYLHHDCSPPIIHRDVKSSNILLDAEFNAKLADFGLAKFTVTTGEPHTASAVAGSFGYIAPEYWRTRRLNEKIDIYSFGVVLLELATGKDPCKGNDHLNLADWSRQHYCEEYPIIDALDREILEPAITEQMVNVFKLGLMCTSRMPSSRPTMKQVLQLLISFSLGDNHGQTQMVNEE